MHTSAHYPLPLESVEIQQRPYALWLWPAEEAAHFVAPPAFPLLPTPQVLVRSEGLSLLFSPDLGAISPPLPFAEAVNWGLQLTLVAMYLQQQGLPPQINPSYIAEEGGVLQLLLPQRWFPGQGLSVDPAFVPPEGALATPSAWIYALGLQLLWWGTGETLPALQARDAISFAPGRFYWPEAPEPLWEELLALCLAPNPQDRFADLDALYAWLCAEAAPVPEQAAGADRDGLQALLAQAVRQGAHAVALGFPEADMVHIYLPSGHCETMPMAAADLAGVRQALRQQQVYAGAGQAHHYQTSSLLLYHWPEASLLLLRWLAPPVVSPPVETWQALVPILTDLEAQLDTHERQLANWLQRLQQLSAVPSKSVPPLRRPSPLIPGNDMAPGLYARLLDESIALIEAQLGALEQADQAVSFQLAEYLEAFQALAPTLKDYPERLEHYRTQAETAQAIADQHVQENQLLRGMLEELENNWVEARKGEHQAEELRQRQAAQQHHQLADKDQALNALQQQLQQRQSQQQTVGTLLVRQARQQQETQRALTEAQQALATAEHTLAQQQAQLAAQAAQLAQQAAEIEALKAELKASQARFQAVAVELEESNQLLNQLEQQLLEKLPEIPPGEPVDAIEPVEESSAQPIAPPPPASPDWLYIPAGSYKLGDSRHAAEQPAHTVDLPAFEVARLPVTNREFAQFMADGGYANPDWWTPEGWAQIVENGLRSPAFWNRPEHFSGIAFPDHPVVGVSWYEALAYASWKGVRLPREAEWETACRGPEGAIYPWGPDWENGRTNTRENGPGHLLPSDAYPGGASGWGCLDLIGNTFEWTSSLYKPYPYQMGDGREDLRSRQPRTLRGCAWGYKGPYFTRASYRFFNGPATRQADIGFRCVRDLEI
jgi:formylglycine-generating enzyme required for sulfatase activity